jgi:dynein heavy chain
MQPHLRKVFESVVRVELDSDETTATAMVSAEGEVVNLKNCVLRGGEVEEWMRIVEEQMRYSLKIATRTSLIHYENEDRKDWVLKHPT